MKKGDKKSIQVSEIGIGLVGTNEFNNLWTIPERSFVGFNIQYRFGSVDNPQKHPKANRLSYNPSLP